MSTTFAVDLVFKSQTKQLNDLQRKLNQLEVNLNKIKGGKPFKPIEDGAQDAGVKVNGLVKTLGKLALAYGALRAGQAAISAGIDRIESERRIQFLAQGYGEAAQLAQAASEAARRFGVSQTEANEALATTYARLRPVGVSLEEIKGIYAGFSTAARISGASATEAEGAFRQLAQGLGSGALRGDEFNSVAEQVPLILTAVSKETGIAQGALREYAAEGKITSDVVIRALKRIEKEGADQLEAALDGPQQKIKDFQNASEDLAVAFSRELVPEMTGAISELAQTLRDLIPILRAIGRIAAAVFKYIGGLARRINDMMNGAKMAQAELQADAQAQKQTRGKFGVFGSLTKEAQDYRARVKQAQLQAAKDALNPIPELSTAAAPDFGGGTVPTGGSSSTGSKRGGGRSTKERESQVPQLTAELALKQKLFALEGQIGAARLEGNKALEAALEMEKILLERQGKINEISASGVPQAEQELQIKLATLEADEKLVQASQARQEAEKDRQKRLQDLLGGMQREGELALAVNDQERQRLELEQKIAEWKKDGVIKTEAEAQAIRNGNAELQKKLQLSQQLNIQQEQMNNLLNGIGSQFKGLFDTLIQGTNDWNAVLSDTLRQFSSLLLSAGLGMLDGGDGKGFFSFLNGGLGKRASGGPVTGGTPYIVGERGPELFVPGRSGGIVPNDQLGGGSVNSVVNVTINSDGSSSTDASQGEKLGRQINSAVKAVIMHERRPGGLLSR